MRFVKGLEGFHLCPPLNEGVEMNWVKGPHYISPWGQCLQIDPVPRKTCNFDCVYCAMGRTDNYTNERIYSPAPREILDQAIEWREANQAREIDWVLFEGSGEPTLHIGFGWLVREIGSLIGSPVAVLTNGSLLGYPEVRAELSQADAVALRLDAGSTDTYRRINRPRPEISFHDLLRGLVSFRHDYHGVLSIRLTLLKSMNDGTLDLERMSAVLHRIQPDEIHLKQPPLQPSEAWARSTDEGGLMLAAALLGKVCPIRHPASDDVDLMSIESLHNATIHLIARHPMRVQELAVALARWQSSDIQHALVHLSSAGWAHEVVRYGNSFWTDKPADVPQERTNLSSESTLWPFDPKTGSGDRQASRSPVGKITHRA